MKKMCKYGRLQYEKSVTWTKCNRESMECKEIATWKKWNTKRCKMESIHHENSATRKKWKMKIVQHKKMQDESVQHVAGKMCNMKKSNRESIQRDEKCSRERLQQDASDTWKEWNLRKNARWKECIMNECNMNQVQRQKPAKQKNRNRESTPWIKCNGGKVQHETSATWKNCSIK